MVHVSKRVTLWIEGEGKGAVGNHHETLCGLEVIETEKPGPFIDWAGWRATCGECVVKSMPAWQPWVNQVFKLAQTINAGDTYNDAKTTYAQKLGYKQ